MWTKLSSYDCPGDIESFWKALQIWLVKPHVLNRRLCGSNDVLKVTLTSTREVKLSEHSLQDLRDAAVAGLDKLQETLPEVMAEAPVPEMNSRKIDLLVQEHLPKKLDHFSTLRELILLDPEHGTAAFYPLVNLKPGTQELEACPDICYCLTCDTVSQQVDLFILGDPQRRRDATNVSVTAEYLQNTVLPKLVQWSRCKDINTEQSSLRLVHLQRYNQLYQEIKTKYGLNLVQTWPEGTDPQKFVFEDVAIAAYLITLWEQEREESGCKKKQSFVDLGCGNGLLVHLLAQMGYEGVGIDIRRRGIWDMYGEKTKLMVQTLTPSDEHLFPQYDWLIGNHSDELTPWIPVMAARSSFECRYFVLPCCTWDFDAKFSGNKPGTSQYRLYLNYIEEIGQECGFEVKHDVLRIPSTKRSCMIGSARTYNSSLEKEMDLKRAAFISRHCKDQKSMKNPIHISSHTREDTGSVVSDRGAASNSDDMLDVPPAEKKLKSEGWAAEFSPRPAEERARNVKTINSAVKDRIMGLVFQKLLTASDRITKQLPDGRTWNGGGSLPLSSVVSMVDRDSLKLLKNECGGLQTLLRNCHHIFRVQGGTVYIREWDSAEEQQRAQDRAKQKGRNSKDNQKLFKSRLCWLHDHHPDGCPRSLSDCSFAHGPQDLKSSNVSDKAGVNSQSQSSWKEEASTSCLESISESR